MPTTETKSFLYWLVAITAFTQAISPALTSFTGRDGNDPQITPAGYAFAVWGVITTLALVYGVYQAIPANRTHPVFGQVAPYLIATYIGFGVWLWAAQNNYLWITVAVFVVMFGCLLQANRLMGQSGASFTLVQTILLKGQLGIYLGWTSVAIFANLASAIKFTGVSDLGPTGQLWQGLVLLGATINVLYCIYSTGSSPFYTATALWALVGVWFGLRNVNGPIVLQIEVAVAILLVLGWFLYQRNTGLTISA
jgi:hypothetical protein